MNRREFVKSAIGSGIAIGTAHRSSPNDRINLGLIGAGGRGRFLLQWATATGKTAETPAQIVAVCDVYGKRRRVAQETAACDGHADYREILAGKDIDAVIIATPD